MPTISSWCSPKIPGVSFFPDVLDVDHQLVRNVLDVDFQVVPDVSDVDHQLVPDVLDVDHQLFTDVLDVDHQLVPDVPDVDQQLVPDIHRLQIPDVLDVDQQIIPDVHRPTVPPHCLHSPSPRHHCGFLSLLVAIQLQVKIQIRCWERFPQQGRHPGPPWDVKGISGVNFQHTGYHCHRPSSRLGSLLKLSSDRDGQRPLLRRRQMLNVWQKLLSTRILTDIWKQNIYPHKYLGPEFWYIFPPKYFLTNIYPHKHIAVIRAFNIWILTNIYPHNMSMYIPSIHVDVPHYMILSVIFCCIIFYIIYDDLRRQRGMI